MSTCRVIIVGGGFAGVTLAQRLERMVASDVDIVLISSENHFVFSPLLAEVVGRSITPLHVVVAGRQMVRRTTWMTARVTDVEWPNNLVHYVGAGEHRASLTYDHLVLACGSVVNLNLVPGMAAYAYPLKTLGDAIFLGNDLIARLEEAAVASEPEERRRLLPVVVIGGGFSGVEVAGEIAEVMARTRRFYPALHHERPRIVLLQRSDHLLPELHAPSLSDFACTKLRQSGVEVCCNSEVEEVTATGVRLKSGQHMETATVVSTIGTTVHPLMQTLGLPLQGGRLVTDPDMRVTGTSNVWALGDCAVIPNAYDGQPSPPTAQFATRQARQLAANLAHVSTGRPTEPFAFKPLGMLASLGHRNGVAEILGWKISGFPAWFLWRCIYLGKLPSLARKIEVMVDWLWKMFFPPNIVELQLSRTAGVGRAHYATGEFVFRKGDAGVQFFVIESGTAAVYVGERAAPAAMLKPGDHFGEEALLSRDGKGVHTLSVQAATPLDLMTVRRDDFARLSASLRVLRQDIERSLSVHKGQAGLVAMVQDDPRLAAIRVADVMTSPAETLAPHLTLVEVIERFSSRQFGYPVVAEDGRLLGYCGLAELYGALRELTPATTRVSDFMRQAPPSVTANRLLVEAMMIHMREQIELLTVVRADDNSTVVGTLSPFDVIRKAIAPLARSSRLS
jgi:NADH dehydrogenase